MNPRKIPIWLIASILATAAFSLYSISYRYRAEQRNKAVSIALEYEAIENYAAASHMSMPNALQELKEQGLRSVVLSEETVGDLASAGDVEFTPKGIKPTSAPVRDRLMRGLITRLGGEWVSVPEPTTPIPVNELSNSSIRGIAVGLDPGQTTTVKSAGLTIIARMSNPQGVSGDYVKGTIDWAHELGAEVFLPQGDQVLGRRGAMKELVDQLKFRGMLYASPEFTKLGGDANVLVAAPDICVRLHSAQAAELDKMPIEEAVDRYFRAARERGMRILLVRPLAFASSEPLNSLKDFVRQIAHACAEEGLSLNTAHPSEEPHVPLWLFLLIGLSIVPTAFFALSTLSTSKLVQLGGAILILAIGAATVTKAGREFAALMGAISFPYVAFVILDSRRKLNIVLDFVLVSLVSLVGGLAVAGLLNSLPYYIRADQFFGVKLAVFLPILLVAYYFVSRAIVFRETFKNPVTWGAAALSLLVLVGLLFMSSRTGNDNPAGVSDLELKMRFILDNVLLVRPRTKELLIGHPLLILGIGMLILQRRTGNRKLGLGTALALAGGAIGQTDIVNTMCHIHTPVALSLMRIGVGMVAGCIIGLAVWVVAKRWLPAGET